MIELKTYNLLLIYLIYFSLRSISLRSISDFITVKIWFITVNIDRTVNLFYALERDVTTRFQVRRQE